MRIEVLLGVTRHEMTDLGNSLGTNFIIVTVTHPIYE